MISYARLSSGKTSLSLPTQCDIQVVDELETYALAGLYKISIKREERKANKRKKEKTGNR